MTTERPVGKDDLVALAGIFKALDESLTGRPSHLDAQTVAGWIWQEAETLLIEEDGAAVAGVFLDIHGPTGIFGGAVHPAAHGRGHGSRLADFAEERLLAREPGLEKLHTWGTAGDAAAQVLFTSRGYREVRRFWDMAIELGEDEPSVPDLEIETFGGEEDDARAFHAALDEAFSDHWNHHSTPFEKWWEEKRAQTDYDPSIWFLIRDGEEVAAVTRNDPDRHGGGYIGALGVRRPWRGKGYGKALLQHSFREFHRRGKRRVSLGVDATNPTGATKLYESVGMSVEMESVVYEKALA